MPFTTVPIRLTRGTALTPCCSAIEHLPDSIPPGGCTKLAVVFKPGYQTGLKRVQFTVDTDSKDRPVRPLALMARLLPVWEVIPIGSHPQTYPLGAGGTRSFRVSCRREGNEGFECPETIHSTNLIEAAFTGPAEYVPNPGAARSSPDDIAEATRPFVVRIPAGSRAGLQRSEIQFRWPDGQMRKHVIEWDVVPRIRAVPAGVVVKRSAGAVARTVILTSDRRPFRVMNVRGAILGDDLKIPPGLGLRHELRIPIDPGKLAGDPGSFGDDISIATDHPDQPIVAVSVLILGGGEETGQ